MMPEHPEQFVLPPDSSLEENGADAGSMFQLRHRPRRQGKGPFRIETARYDENARPMPWLKELSKVWRTAQQKELSNVGTMEPAD